MAFRQSPLTHCKRGCGREHAPSCLAQREIVYLGQVGCFDHLSVLADVVGLSWSPEPQYAPRGGAIGHKSAFQVYEAALEYAREALEGGVLGREVAVGTLTPAMGEARAIRGRLAKKGHVVPGRHGWLKEAQAALGEVA